MSADNWTICPDCIKRIKELQKAFIKKYYGKIDGFVYGKMLQAVNDAVEYIESDSCDEHKPDEEILKLMREREISVECYGNTYDADEILCNGDISSSLREDYEQGVDDDGFVYIRYSCCCNCGFNKEIEFNEKEKLIINKGDTK